MTMLRFSTIALGSLLLLAACGDDTSGAGGGGGATSASIASVASTATTATTATSASSGEGGSDPATTGSGGGGLAPGEGTLLLHFEDVEGDLPDDSDFDTAGGVAVVSVSALGTGLSALAPERQVLIQFGEAIEAGAVMAVNPQSTYVIHQQDRATDDETSYIGSDGGTLTIVSVEGDLVTFTVDGVSMIGNSPTSLATFTFDGSGTMRLPAE